MKSLKKYILKFEASFPLYPIISLFIIGFILYFRSVSNVFVGDDYFNIIQNNLVHRVSNIPQIFTADPLFNIWPFYRPLMYVVFSLIYSVFGLQAGFYHLFDLLLHILNVILLFIFFKKIFIMQKFRFSQTLAFLLSIIFLVHPVNVETVAYVAVTQDLMLAFFFLSGLLLADLYCRRKKTSLVVIFLIHLLVLACLLSKESGIFPVVMIPTFCYLLYKKLNKITISFGVTPLITYLLMRLIWDRIAMRLEITTIPIHNVGITTRLITLPYEMVSYIRLIFFPKDLYMFQQDIIYRVSDPRFYVSLLISIVAAVVIGWLFLKYKSRLLTFFLLWIVFSFAMLSNIVVTLSNTVAERWMYVPLIGILGFLGLVITHLVKHKKILLFLSLVIIVFIPLAMARTYTRIGDWYDSKVLLLRDISYEKGDANAYDSYALQLLAQGNIKGSLYYFEQAFKIQPDNIQIKIHLGIALAKDGRLPEAKKLFYEMLGDKNNIVLYDYIAGAYVNVVDTKPKPDDVIYLLQKPILLSPKDILLNRMMAIAYFRKQDWQSALVYAKKVYQLQPSAENQQSVDTVESNLMTK